MRGYTNEKVGERVPPPSKSGGNGVPRPIHHCSYLSIGVCIVFSYALQHECYFLGRLFEIFLYSYFMHAMPI